MSVIGFDTSNYTTSIAFFDGNHAENISQLLPVKAGELGLRQSDAVFHHTKSLPELSSRLFCNVNPDQISAVGVSTRPRNVDGSYMPCFMVGYSHAKMLSEALHVPLYEFSHQEGHIAAAAWSAGRMDLLDMPHLAWHLSGGTTELLYVEPKSRSVTCSKIGGTSDISAGQLIDRTGQLLDLPFPSGKHLDELSENCFASDFFQVKCTDMTFSFSGVQNKVQEYYKKCPDAIEVAGYALRSICNTILRATQNAMKKYPGVPVVFSGGVSSNRMLRRIMSPVDPIFAEPRYSTDNALGTAVLTYRMQED